MFEDLRRALTVVADALEGLGIAYCVGGSVASGEYGEPRLTNDVDVLIEIGGWQVRPFVDALRREFYVDEVSVAEAVASGRSFNAIHLKMMLKVDFFVATDRPLDRMHLAHRRPIVVDPETGRTAFFTSPEDIVLQKLDWYRQSNGVLDSQLRDVAGVLKVKATALDLVYLRGMAQRLGLSDLLDASLKAAGLSAQ